MDKIALEREGSGSLFRNGSPGHSNFALEGKGSGLRLYSIIHGDYLF